MTIENEFSTQQIELKKIQIILEPEMASDEDGNDVEVAAGTKANVVFEHPLVCEDTAEGTEVLLILKDAFEDIFEDDVEIKFDFKINKNIGALLNVDLKSLQEDD